MALNIEYKASTENDIADLAQSLLMVRAVSALGKSFIEGRIELKEGYYDLQNAFDTISMLIEPALTYFCYDGRDIAREKNMSRQKKKESFLLYLSRRQKNFST